MGSELNQARCENDEDGIDDECEDDAIKNECAAIFIEDAKMSALPFFFKNECASMNALPSPS